MKCWSSSRAPTNSSEQLCTSHRPGCENDSLTCTMFASCQGSNTCHNDHTLHIQQWDGEEEDWRHSIVQQLVIQLLWVIERCQESGNTIAGFKWYNSHCIKLTIVNMNIVMQLPWHPFCISSGSEKMCFPFLYKIVLIMCERYHDNGCRHHMEQPLKGKDYVSPCNVWLYCNSSWWPSWILHVH